MLNVEYFVYIAFAFALVGYLARDELWLRLLMLAASANYLAYYYTVADVPLWNAIYTSGALALVNLVMICVVVLERTTFAMSRQVAAIFRSFDMLTPGQFRRMMRYGTVRTADETVRLTTEGMRVDKLCYVTAGKVVVTKEGRRTEIPPRIFVGEIAYATGNNDISIQVFTRDNSEMFKFVTEVIGKIPGVRKTHISFVPIKVKDDHVWPIPSSIITED